jgi:hypothetical protein
LFTNILIYIFLPPLMLLFWTVSFGVVEHSKDTAGWISVNAALTTLFYVVLIKHTIGLLFVFLGLLQMLGSCIIVFGRLDGSIGSVAYKITDTHGCLPFNGTAYLEQGARSGAFKTVQVVEWSVAFLIMFSMVPIGLCLRRCINDNDDEYGLVKLIISGVWAVTYLPVLIYEIVVATKGRPVVMSGNCMLVELDPKLGFLDSRIDTWWKALVSLVGL